MARLPSITSKDQVAPKDHAIVDGIVQSRGALQGPFTMFLHCPAARRGRSHPAHGGDRLLQHAVGDGEGLRAGSRHGRRNSAVIGDAQVRIWGRSIVVDRGRGLV